MTYTGDSAILLRNLSKWVTNTISIATTCSAAAVSSFSKVEDSSTRGKCSTRGVPRTRTFNRPAKCPKHRGMPAHHKRLFLGSVLGEPVLGVPLVRSSKKIKSAGDRRTKTGHPKETQPTQKETHKRAEQQLLSPRPTRWARGANILQGERGRVYSDSGHHDVHTLRPENLQEQHEECESRGRAPGNRR